MVSLWVVRVVWPLCLPGIRAGTRMQQAESNRVSSSSLARAGFNETSPVHSELYSCRKHTTSQRSPWRSLGSTGHVDEVGISVFVVSVVSHSRKA